MASSVYLDHNATAPLLPQAALAMTEAMREFGNPSSVHRHGRLARRRIEDAREQVARLVGADPANVIFTGSGTEANALALRGAGRKRVLVSAVEHASVLRAREDAEVIPVDQDGLVRLDALSAMLAASDEPALVSVMLANNETGVVQPVSEVAALASRHGALVHCDAAQAAGKMKLDWAELDVHLLSLSAHKLGGPSGVGALIVDPSVMLAAALRGGGQERGRRAGTENVLGIAGFGAAAEAVELEHFDDVALLRDRLEQRLRAICPSAKVFGGGVRRLPNTSCVAMPAVPAETQVIAFDLASISVSAGAACSSGKVTRSHVLRAMGVGDDLAGTAIRVSLGWTSLPSDVDRFVEVWSSICGRAQARRGVSVPAAIVARR